MSYSSPRSTEKHPLSSLCYFRNQICGGSKKALLRLKRHRNQSFCKLAMPESESSESTLVPPVFWAQRKDSLYLLIHVPDCLNPTINVEKDKLCFRGKGGTDKKDYEITLEFHKEIKTEESRYAVKGRGPEFVLKKMEDGPYWPRLLKDTKKQHWLKIDFNKWKDEDDSDNEEKDVDFDKIMQDMAGLNSGGDNSLNDLDSGSSDDDDDELEPQQESAATGSAEA